MTPPTFRYHMPFSCLALCLVYKSGRTNFLGHMEQAKILRGRSKVFEIGAPVKGWGTHGSNDAWRDAQPEQMSANSRVQHRQSASRQYEEVMTKVRALCCFGLPS